jgi:hypothetical protein
MLVTNMKNRKMSMSMDDGLPIRWGTNRREFLAAAVAAGFFGPAFLKDALAAPAVAGEGPYGPLLGPDANGLMLPAGFQSRVVARGGDLVGGYPWHFASDGQATFRTLDGGWVLVSNSEVPAIVGGGSSAIRFSPDGEVERGYRILSSNMNCGGGPTPWGTWLSGEEHPGGLLWEADPAGILPAQPRPALGNFPHEAAAVDPATGFVYETEDQGDGCFYRFRPDRYGDLTAGVLEVAVVAADNSVTWREVPDPNIVTAGKETRNQVPGATRFNGGEGIWHDDGIIYFTTKGDRRVWAYDVIARTIEIIFDRKVAPDSSLDAVDNVTVSASGDVYVCEDGGNMEIGIITPERVVSAFVRIVSPDHDGSEMTGVIFDPSGTRMYFGSQRAFPFAGALPLPAVPSTVLSRGCIFEVTGPFRLPEGGVPASKVFGPPAGERLGLPADVPGLSVRAPKRLTRRGLDELRVSVTLDEPATVRAVLRTADVEKVSEPRWLQARPKLTLLGRRERRAGRGRRELRIPVDASRLPRGRETRAVLTVVATTARGKTRVAAREIRISPR